MRSTRIVVLSLGVGALVGSAAAADDPWIEVKSPHFTVVSNAGEGRARNVAWQFEQIRAAIQAGWPWARVQLDRPVMVIAAKDESSMKLLLPQYWEKGGGSIRPVSVFATASDRYYIALRSDARAEDTLGVNPYYASYWTYSALVLDAAFERQLPLWFRTGLAEVLSNSIVRDTELQFGRAIPWHVASLQQEGRLRLAELLKVDASSPYFTNGVTRRRFDAQCWGVLHYLLFGRPEDRADRVNQLAKLLLGGKSSADAVQEVFGSVDALEEAYLQYQKRPISQYSRLKVDTNASSKSFPARPLAPADSAALRAALHGGMGRAVEARVLIAEARTSAAEAPGSYEVEGMLLDREGKQDEARAAYAKATELSSNNFYTHYRLATLMWRTTLDAETRATIEKLLRRSVTLNDSYAPSHALLADTIVLGAQPAGALEPATRAVALDPGDSGLRLSLARVLWRLSRRDDAKGHARAALSLARNEQQRGQAQELIDFFARAQAN